MWPEKQKLDCNFGLAWFNKNACMQKLEFVNMNSAMFSVLLSDVPKFVVITGVVGWWRKPSDPTLSSTEPLQWHHFTCPNNSGQTSFNALMDIK